MAETPILPLTRFHSLSRAWALAALVAFTICVAAGIFGGVAVPHSLRPQLPGAGDGILYAHVVERVAAGESFYAATTAEQRAVNGTLKPVFAVREPLLAIFLAALPDTAARTLALRLLCVSVLLAWGWRLSRVHPTAFSAFALLCLCCGLFADFAPQAWVWHEAWAGGLIMLALAVYRPQRWGWAVLIGLLAALVRELAAPFLLAMAAAALWERRWHEAAGWGGATLLFVGAILLHALCLAPYVHADDPASTGWLAFGGWPYMLLLHSTWNMALAAAPVAIVALLVPLMLLGATAWPGGLGLRLMLLCIGYSAGFLIVGRPDTPYWGLLTTPLTALALAMAPAALRDAFRQIFATRSCL